MQNTGNLMQFFNGHSRKMTQVLSIAKISFITVLHFHKSN